MQPNPLLGVVFHWLGGLASGSFYVPYKGVKRWSWETYWLVGGFFSWLIAPWFFALLNTTDVLTVLKETPGHVWFYTYLFGLLWGFGGLTFGLTMRYLGMSLGMAVAPAITLKRMYHCVPNSMRTIEPIPNPPPNLMRPSKRCSVPITL